MANLFENYITAVAAKFTHKETSEMGYRSDFEILLKGIFESIKVERIDHDARATNGNKPDFVVIKNVPILYIEAKDISVSLDKIEKSEQMARYFGYSNLVLTDYLEFRFYRNGLRYGEPIKIGESDLKKRQITALPGNYELLVRTLLDFAQSHKEPIKSGEHLAKIMGGKALRIRDNVNHFFENMDLGSGGIFGVYEAIRNMLVRDLTPQNFADMYAQTLVYGLFVARYYDKTPESFTRQEARDLIPASNPFLGSFFDHIAGRNFEQRLALIVDELCEVFSHADVKELMTQYFKKDLWGQVHESRDPVIHFYEDFLKEYDPELRKKMGAYYTPLPVVRFIVGAIDDLLKKDFNLPGGLADTAQNNLAGGLHKVQILDPAVGTGTFLSAVIENIYKRQRDLGQTGSWPRYVHHGLLPRLYGFELMMAPYTIAHLKISMKLQETGFKYFNETREGKTRLKLYLTNSLEGPKPQKELFAFDFGAAIAEEAKEADKIKNEKPIMVVVGNPPYSVSSSNKGDWIQELIADYKTGLNERKINLDDDYIKFIRFAEHFIEKNKTGIVAMITNNSFIDGITHRQMRKHLLETFDDIYILDLHGNAKKKEKAPDGGKDENVFDIQQGVGISIFVRKNESKTGLGQVYHAELFGKRERKFEALDKNTIKTIEWAKLGCSAPYYFFVPKDFKTEGEYKNGFSLDELIPLFNSGIQTKNDSLSIQFEELKISQIQNDFLTLSENELKIKYQLDDSPGWKLSNAKKNIVAEGGIISDIQYRVFDRRKIIYTKQSSGFLGRPREKTSKHFVYHDNIGILARRNTPPVDFTHIFITNSLISEGVLGVDPNGREYVFPLYLYAEDGTKAPNLKGELVGRIEKIVGKTTPEDIFDYIYAVLYSPSYRTKYKEFLKIDFPRVPYPRDARQFDTLVALGRELRQLHLLESPKVAQFITNYPNTGSDTVEKIIYKDGKVFINSGQYFGSVPENAWNHYIGGYQPAQKWLKDRKGRQLSYTDIDHYQKIIVALAETARIMQEIDKVYKG